MRLKLSACIAILLITSFVSHAQVKKTAIVKGKLLNNITKSGFNDLKVTIPDLNVFTTADGEGEFSISEVPYGTQTIVISGINAKNDTIKVVVDKEIVVINDVSITPSEANIPAEEALIPTIAIEGNIADNTDDDASSSGQSAGGLFASGNDPFIYAAINFITQFRFQQRGYNSVRGINSTELQINGIQINDLERNVTTASQLGGLNDVLHGRNQTFGLNPSEYSYGGLNGETYVDATAADQRKGTTASYSIGNRNYRDKVMLTYNSGLMKNGWAFSASASHRWANEGYVQGTFYDGYSFYGAISKVVKSSQFNLTAIAAPTKRGGAEYAATDETYKLAKDNQYNDDWGYQDGKKRNAKITNVSQPIFIANYTYKPSERTRWNTSVGYEFGKYRSSTIDGYNSYSPYGDYYRNLPSYYENATPPALGAASAVRSQIQGNPNLLQINWDGLYNANYTNFETIKNVNGIAGNDFTGRRSLYVVSDYVDDEKTLSFNSNIEHVLNEHLILYGGLKATSQNDENYRQLTDLLGGDYFVNYNQFATQQAVANPNATQNDIVRPNQVIKTGDKYGYDYRVRILQGDAWGQASFMYNKFEFFAAADAGHTSFSREGYMQNGLFPNNSLGKSDAQNFLTYKVKGGVTYKFDLRNFLYLNAEYRQDAPTVANTYISVATRDYTINNPTAYKSKTLEGGYMLKSTVFSARISGYVTDISDFSTIMRFYNDDPSILSFVNFVMNNVSMRSIGTEVSGTWKINKMWNLTGVASVGQMFYTNSPTVSVYQDNDPSMTGKPHQVYIKNYYAGTGPQSIYALKADYHSRSYWNGSITGNYIDRSYVGINPDRSTSQAADLVPIGSPQWEAITQQEKLPGAFTIDVYGGKSFLLGKYYKKLKHRTTLLCNLGIQNLLNDKDIKIGGYEQLRYDYTNRNTNKFPNKYAYAYGRTFLLNFVLRF